MTLVTMAETFRHAYPTPHVHKAGTRAMTAEKPPHRPSSGPAGASTGAGLAAPATQVPSADDDRPRIAVYAAPLTPPLVIPMDDLPPIDEHLPTLIETLATRTYDLAREQGGQLPLDVFRELAANLVHASFRGVVITILDHGNTVRFSDRGPGIPDKDAALRPGFTSADSPSKRFIRGVGSGLPLIRQTLADLDGELEIDDNLGQGTVVTVRLHGRPNIRLAPAALPSYNLSERQLKTLLLAVELAPVGPTRIAEELGVST